MIDLRLGSWERVLADVGTVAALITDVPYSERTIKGQRSGTIGCGDGPTARIAYAPLSERQTRAVVRLNLDRVQRFMVIFCDHIQWVWLDDECQRAGWMTFQPIPWVKKDGTPRFTADGPSAQSEWIMIARPRGSFTERFRPGYYETRVAKKGGVTGIVGTKPLHLMRAIVRDYSEPGDTILEPFAGSGTTPMACAIEGRHCIAAEIDFDNAHTAATRIDQGIPLDLFAAGAA